MQVTDLPIFIPDDVTTILNRMKSNYEVLVNKNLQPGQAEALLIQAVGYEVKLVIDGFNEGARMQLVQFAEGAMLDYIVKFLGLVRLPASRAGVTIRFTIIGGAGTVIIPAGTRVQSMDGQAVFRTQVATTVIGGGSPVTSDVSCECITPGVVGNGYTTGQISNIIDPYAFISGASNTTTSGGGAEIESDDHLRERFYLAPSEFSNAGSVGAYKFWTLTASSAIIDVSIQDPPSVPGTVVIYPMVAGGIVTPTPVLDAVLAALSDDNIKCLNDTLSIVSPSSVAYNITIGLTLYNSADDAAVLIAINAAIDAYVDKTASKLGLDIVKSEIVKLCKEVDGVYDAVVTAPSSNVAIAISEFPLLGTKTVAISGHTNG